MQSQDPPEAPPEAQRPRIGVKTPTSTGSTPEDAGVAVPAAVPYGPPREPEKLMVVGDPAQEDPARFRRVGSFFHDSENPTHLSWGRYCDWRRSKCPPSRGRPRWDELNQATHEMVGEASELALLLIEHGPDVLTVDDLTDRFLDEAGDVIFCSCWALDAWGWNVLLLLATALGEEPAIIPRDRLSEEDEYWWFLRQHVVHCGPGGPASSEDVSMRWKRWYENHASTRACTILAHLGSTANAVKKLVYQGREQSPQEQCEAIVIGLSFLQRLLVVSGLTISRALEKNIEKLDARYPDGYRAGGGERSGKGK